MREKLRFRNAAVQEPLLGERPRKIPAEATVVVRAPEAQNGNDLGMQEQNRPRGIVAETT